MNTRVLFILLGLGIYSAVAAEDTAPLDTDKRKASYVMGLQFGQSIRSRVSDLDYDAVILGIGDVLSAHPPRISAEEMRSAIAAYREEIISRRAALAQKNLQAASGFLEQNKGRAEVTTLASGLQYRVLASGDGNAHPGSEDTVVVHYRGHLIDGREFDSSFSRGEPATLTVNQVIPGWQEALTLMTPGDSWEVFVPPTLAYGESGAGQAIGPNEALVFQIDLIEIKSE